MLIGLACKNAILIVEFAKAQREAGVPRYQATLEACNLRLRPIVMTSFAFILGVVPLVLSEGAGAEMRRTLGTAVFGGMLGVTLFGIFLTPVFYYVIQWFADLRTPRKKRPAAVLAKHEKPAQHEKAAKEVVQHEEVDPLDPLVVKAVIESHAPVQIDGAHGLSGENGTAAPHAVLSHAVHAPPPSGLGRGLK